VTEFEKASGCKVNVKTAGTSDEMVQLMNQGGTTWSPRRATPPTVDRGKKVQEINVELIPSWKEGRPAPAERARTPSTASTTATPYQWGANVLMLQHNVFKAAPDSWAVIFEEMNLPDGKPNAKRIQAYDGPIYIADAHLPHGQAARPGHQGPYELNEKQYKAALDVLRKQKTLVHRYWHDANVQVQDFSPRASSPRRAGRSR
jgi:putative spermidine/putrescine transport system substrate-binding protein